MKGRAAEMDATTLSLKNMYEEFPYPSRQLGAGSFRELRNLLHFFTRETGFDFNGKSVLDAGTGTGHRLAAAAELFPHASLTAVDVSKTSLSIARQHAALRNARLEQVNLAGDLSHLGRFDVIFCMGVLHHLSSPLQGLLSLTSLLNEDGIIFLYVYGQRGANERMRRKEIIRALLADDPDFAIGIQLIKDLGFDTFEYGWNVQTTDERVREGLLVDAYLNVNETAFTSDTLRALLAGAGLSAFVTYGVTTAQAGYLFDTEIGGKVGLGVPRTDAGKFLASDLARRKYEALPLEDRIRVIDLLYQPSGYTVVGLINRELGWLQGADRLARNLSCL